MRELLKMINEMVVVRIGSEMEILTEENGKMIK